MITTISEELLIRRISIAPRELQLQVCYYSAFNSSSKWCIYSNCGNGSGFLCTALQRLGTRSKWLTSHLVVTDLSCLQADESTSAGAAPAKHVCPGIPLFAISWYDAPDGSSARQSKIQILKIPVLIFTPVHVMKLNHSQHNRAPEAGWSFLWVPVTGNTFRAWFLSSHSLK